LHRKEETFRIDPKNVVELRLADLVHWDHLTDTCISKNDINFPVVGLDVPSQSIEIAKNRDISLNSFDILAY